MGERLTPWSSGAEGGKGTGRDIREQLLLRGDGVPCVGARAACLQSWLDSKHLFPFPVLSIAIVDRRRMTHPSGWTCRAGQQWVAELAWAGLPFRWSDRVGWLRGKGKRSKWREAGKGTRREGDRLGFTGFYIISARACEQIWYCTSTALSCVVFSLLYIIPPPVTNEEKSTAAILICRAPARVHCSNGQRLAPVSLNLPSILTCKNSSDIGIH